MEVSLNRFSKYLGCLAVIVLLSSCGLPQARSITEFVTVENQKISLTLSMTIGSTMRVDQRWLAEFQIYNNSLSAVSFLPWGTPWEGTFSRDIFYIESAGRKIEYIGPMIKRSAPSARDYIEIKPGASQLVKLDISNGYNLENRGAYSLTYQPGSLSLINQGQEFVVATPSLAPMLVKVGQK
ncbi:MAG: hypothetical protein ACJAY7_001170 [Pseudohongiellaceae bacterium]